MAAAAILDLQGRINHLVGPTRSTTPGPHWKARPNQLGVLGALYKLLGGVWGKAPARQKTDLVKFEIEKYITDDKDFGNFKRTVIVKMTCQSSTDNDF